VKSTLKSDLAIRMLCLRNAHVEVCGDGDDDNWPCYMIFTFDI
jgi:hypothetical protein